MVKCLIFSRKQHPYFYCGNRTFMYINTSLNPKKQVFSIQTDQAFNHVHPQLLCLGLASYMHWTESKELSSFTFVYFCFGWAVCWIHLVHRALNMLFRSLLRVQLHYPRMHSYKEWQAGGRLIRRTPIVVAHPAPRPSASQQKEKRTLDHRPQDWVWLWPTKYSPWAGIKCQLNCYPFYVRRWAMRVKLV